MSKRTTNRERLAAHIQWSHEHEISADQCFLLFLETSKAPGKRVASFQHDLTYMSCSTNN